MIPYVEVGPWEVGAFRFQPFGMLVLVGVAAFLWAARRRGLELGLWPNHVLAGAALVMGAAFVGGHLLFVLADAPERLEADPMQLLAFSQGQSLFGGLAGGTLAGVVYLLVRRFPLLLFAESLVYGTLVALIFGRLGCALAHDHPGHVTTFWGAVTGWPDGTTRHDLGLYDLVLIIVLTVSVHLLRNRRELPGLQVAVPMIGYGAVRFGLDFLRSQDPRYGGLTPAQYGALLLLAGGVAVLAYGWRWRRLYPGAPLAVTPPPDAPTAA